MVLQLSFGLKQEQSQKMIITPELRQAIAILQMSALELNQFLEKELQENPFLEKVSEEAETTEQWEQPEESFDIDWQNYFQDSSDLGYQRPSMKGQNDYNFEAFTAKAPDLTEHLDFQLTLTTCPAELRPVVAYLIGNLDYRGYLSIELQDVAKELGIKYAQAEAALAILQGMEPAGVGARTLTECLLLQVQYLGLSNPLLKILITDYLADLAAGRLNKIAAQLGVTVQQVQQAADLLRLLDPKPARNFSGDGEIRYIVPDVTVEKVEGEYIIFVNDTSGPRIRINESYKGVLKDANIDSNARKYVENKLNAAVWLIRGIEQRRLTLYRVANVLVKLQREFLERGVKYLKPLNLRDVAEQLELHESTISRATANKYMQTPQGIFEMKYFFSTGIKHNRGTELSSTSIKQLLQEIVAGEDPQKPLSDQKIADLMQAKGIKISRRTVTKYRDELGILSTTQRKRY